MVIPAGVRITTMERIEKEKKGKKMKARTADNRLAEGVLSAKPVNFKLVDYEVNLWLTFK